MTRKIRIYTRTGDKGDTGLFGGGRVPKDDPRVEAYGRVDELNACLGMLVAAVDEAGLRERLMEIQNDLFDLGADLATPEDSEFRGRLPQLIEEPDWRKLEGWMDEYDAHCPPLRAFVLPGGSEAAARAHYARTVCRTAERALVSLAHDEEVRSDNLVYLNRLSDFLFILGRYLNVRAGVAETEWKQRPPRGA